MSRSTIAGTPRERIFMPLSGSLRIRSKKFCGKIWQKISIFIELPFLNSCLELCYAVEQATSQKAPEFLT